ncbi:MAG: hypothetical protein ABW185_01805 [Sedimenticola sp.]
MQVITGAMNYYGVLGNLGALDAFRTHIAMGVALMTLYRLPSMIIGRI